MQEYKVTVDANGTTRWYNPSSGLYHRDGAPAVTTTDGKEAWYQNGILHRDGGPAMISANGSKFWYQNGVKHREDGHAVEYPDGFKRWYLKGKMMTKQEHHLTLNPPKFKVGDRVSAPAYLDGWVNCTVIDLNFCEEWPIQCVKSDGQTGIFRESELELITVKELTVEEISKLLGYEVKVVKG